MNTQKQIFLIVVSLFVLVGGCAAYTAIDLTYRGPQKEDYQKEESIRRGALLFANNCRTCHGNRGEGGVGLPLHREEWGDQDPLVLQSTRDMLTRTLTCGRAGTLMPSWLNKFGGALNERQIEHIVNLLTAPYGETYLGDAGQPSNLGWQEAEEFAHNLNTELTAIVGGDSLQSIAKRHGIGPGLLSELNDGMPVNVFIERGTTINLPRDHTYTVYRDNETLERIADARYVGAQILAETNGFPRYRLTVERTDVEFKIFDEQGNEVPGLLPGTLLELPDGATYTVTAGDTIQSIAEQHGITPAQLTGLNESVLGDLEADAEIPFERTLVLPEGTRAVVGPTDTLALIATRFNVEESELTQLNNVQGGNGLPAELELPDGTAYTVQPGDSARTLVDRVVTGVTAEELARQNQVGVEEILGSDVVLKLPKINEYKVQGQSLEDLAQNYSNVSPEALAEANEIDPEAPVRVGTALHLPETAWGTAPPDTRNPGTACVQHAVPPAVFEQLPGVGEPAAPVERPATASTEVVIEGKDNDWILTADGVAQPANKGVVLIPRGTTIQFVGVSAIHTITVNREKEGDDLRPGQTRDLTFDTAGTFVITCDYHPPMLANIFVE
ncbi:MAG TPA: LysM peptidoglycan-binding domain-containing protein [Tepidiformaceae bacterium]